MTFEDPSSQGETPRSQRDSGGRTGPHQEIVQLADHLILRLDADDRIVFLNDPFATMLGVEPGEVVGRAYLSFVHPDDREQTREALRRLRLPPHVLRDFQQRVATSGGDQVLNWSLRALLDPEGGVRAIQAVGLDVTELRRSLDELREEHDWALEILEHVPVGVLVVEATTFRVLTHNRRCLDWLAPELSPRSLLGRGVDELLVDPSNRSRVLTLLRDVLRRRESRTTEELVLAGPDASRRRWRWKATPLHTPAGGAVRRLVVVTEPILPYRGPDDEAGAPAPPSTARGEDEGIVDPDWTDATQELPRGNETILLVDDDPMVLEVAAQILADQGYTVIRAGRGEEALALARSHSSPIHLLVTDVVMPGMDGRQLAERIRRLLPTLPVLFISGFADSVFSRSDLEQQGIHLLRKPFTIMALAQRIRSVLDGEGRHSDPGADASN
jgi:PAS domain S-box-containing protein